MLLLPPNGTNQMCTIFTGILLMLLRTVIFDKMICRNTDRVPVLPVLYTFI